MQMHESFTKKERDYEIYKKIAYFKINEINIIRGGIGYYSFSRPIFKHNYKCKKIKMEHE